MQFWDTEGSWDVLLVVVAGQEQAKAWKKIPALDRLLDDPIKVAHTRNARIYDYKKPKIALIINCRMGRHWQVQVALEAAALEAAVRPQHNILVIEHNT